MHALTQKSLNEQLRDALGNRPPDHIWLTTFTLDEGELWRMAYDLGMHGTNRLVVRYDPAGYRPHTDTAILPRSVLSPFCQCPPASKAQTTGRYPAIYHPKICLAEVGQSACLVVSTANLAHDDQRCAANLQCLLALSPHSSKVVREWITSPESNRTICAISRAGEQHPKVSATDESMWRIFSRLREEGVYDQQEWQLASPFWSTTMLAMLRRPDTVCASAFFRDKGQAQAVASSVAGTWLTCHVAPEESPFHHKVLLWRGKRGNTSRTILYIGSANLTRSGFIGLRTGFAHNWEAGCFFVGQDNLWKIGEAAVRAGIDGWHPVCVRPKGPARHDDVGPGAEEDADGLLRIHLSRVIHMSGSKVVRLSSPPPQGFDLRRVELVAGRTRRSLSPGRYTRYPATSNSVTSEAIYRRGYDGRCFPVSLALPQLSCDPISGPDETVEHLRAILRRGGSGSDTAAVNVGVSVDDATAIHSGAADARFPFQELLDCRSRNPEIAKAWLNHVARLGTGVPAFWRAVAKHIVKQHEEG